LGCSNLKTQSSLLTLRGALKQWQKRQTVSARGDTVFGDVFGLGSGNFAQYVSVPESALALKPSNVSFEEAAALPVAAITALQGLRDQGIFSPGKKF